ncbi:hypothetical protein FBY35_2468 [Streptomyces sp. SLBN-118]|nr:hypothetical protein FBY35_2468 [Streptomyces sp. SLBN-118]
MLLSRLRLDEDAEVAQAWDELYIHHLLSQSCEARYEEDENSPDFRLYRSSDYVAGVEVLTLFSEERFDSVDVRNRRLIDEINRRVRPAQWHLSFNVRRWSRQPRATQIAKWLESTISSLGAPAPNLTSEMFPKATYSTPEVELTFTFFPRLRTTAPTPTEQIVLAGPVIGGFVQSDRRIRSRVSKKVGGKYDHRNQPFAIFISVRDLFCDTEEVVNALYGDDVVTFQENNPGSARASRKGNGTFGISKAYPEGRNRRLSCAFVFTWGWTPKSQEPPTVLRFDNPWAEHPFPDDLLVTDRRFAARQHDSGVFMEWEPPLGM